MGALIAAHFAFFWRAALLLGFLAHSDICYFFAPMKDLLHESLRAGRLPLWSPYIFCGYPVAAEGQIAAFYPPGLLISWLLPSPAAINWLVISHLMLAGVSMYVLARRLGLPPTGAWLAAFVFSFSGYLFAHIHHISLICAAAWLPFTLVFIDHAYHSRLVSNACLAALSWAACALCGHPQTLFYVSLAALFWIVWRAVTSGRDELTVKLTRAGAVAGLTFALGTGIASVQLLMTADLSALAPHGERGTLGYVTAFSLLPGHLRGLIAPNWQGTPAFSTYHGERFYWEYVLYVGIVPLVLAAGGGLARRGRVWLCFGAIALLLALAEGNPLYLVLRFLPGFSDFRVPARFIFLFTFAVALLSAEGWYALSRLRPVADGRRAAFIGAALIALTVGDLFRFDATLAPLADPIVYEATPRIVDALRRDEEWSRAWVMPPITVYADWSPPEGWAGNPNGWLEARAYLPASVPQSYDLRVIGGYAGFVDPEHAQFFNSATARALESSDLALYSLVGARYLAVPPEVSFAQLSGTPIPPFTVYRNPEAFPRAFAVGRTIPVPDDATAHLETMDLARAGELRTAAVIRADAPTLDTAQGFAARIEIEEPRPEHIIARASSQDAALLVLNERWDPGWRARLDGTPAPLFEADAVLMATPLPRGEHIIDFVYRPRALVLGRVISVASLCICLSLLATPLFARRRRTD